MSIKNKHMSGCFYTQIYMVCTALKVFYFFIKKDWHSGLFLIESYLESKGSDISSLYFAMVLGASALGVGPIILLTQMAIYCINKSPLTGTW